MSRFRSSSSRTGAAEFLLAASLCLAGCGSNTIQSDLAGADLFGVDLAGADLVGTSAPLMATTSAQIVVEPGDDGATLVQAIAGATTSIHMTMYILSAQTVIDALIARSQAGKEVKVLLNKTFPSGGGSNASVYSQLQTAGVQVRWAPSTFQYTHEKAVVIDGTRALIMTLNASASAFTDNREFAAIDDDATDVAETEAIFQADWAGTAISPTGKLFTAPVNAEDRLVALIDAAVQTLDLEGESLSADPILNALGRAQKRGVAVRIVLSDQTPTNAQALAVMQLKQVSIPVRILKTPYLHAKAIVADGALAYVGSENFTLNSLENNRELGVLIDAKSEVDKVASTINADFNAGIAQ